MFYLIPSFRRGGVIPTRQILNMNGIRVGINPTPTEIQVLQDASG